jgi:hypothetical protein
MRSRLAEPWTLDELAVEVHLSRSQLVRAFDATVGMSPIAYLRQMRAERMARLLLSTDLSIAETGLDAQRAERLQARPLTSVGPLRFDAARDRQRTAKSLRCGDAADAGRLAGKLRESSVPDVLPRDTAKSHSYSLKQL